MTRDRMRVVIAGGGVAALEAVLAIHATAGLTTEVTLVTPEREFLYRPVTVAEAFERGEARSYSVAELVTRSGGGRVVWDAVKLVCSDEHFLVTELGKEIAYDALVIATGATPRQPIPGALTFGGRSDVPALRSLLDELVTARIDSVAFALPSERMWPLPLYELALMTAAYVKDRRSARARVMLVTPEEEPLGLFGPESSEALVKLLKDRGIELCSSSLPATVQGRALILAGGQRLYVDRVVTLPLLEGLRLRGLPRDAHGFIPVDEYGRVVGLRDVFAAGDVTSFPLKQGGFAAQQADAVASVIAASAGAAVVPEPFKPVLRGLLLTGQAPLYLRCEPQRLTGTSSVAIDDRRPRAHGAQVSLAADEPLWWPPAKVAARYLGPYLANAQSEPLGTERLVDRPPIPGPPVSDPEHNDALELALMLAECDARWGDYRSALESLEAARALNGALPPEYETKRRAWTAARRLGD